MYTDLYDEDAMELVEVKASSDRATVRLALGQVLDYVRFIPGAAAAVLLPAKPSADLVELLISRAVSVIWEAEGHGFRRLP